MPKYSVPKGFRDFPPDIMILRKKILRIIEETFIKYGYDPIETPALEYWDTLKGKYGEEAENKLVYKFKDPWSEKWYALRYDLTVPLARFLSNHVVQFPFRRYHISRVWRHENPQRGRYREFWQCDIDIVGSPYPEADAEIVNVLSEALENIGLKDFKIKLNDRRMLAGIFEETLSLKNVISVYRIIDKLDRIGYKGLREELAKARYSNDIIEKISEIISISGLPENVLDEIEEMYGRNRKVSEAIMHLREMMDFIKYKNKVSIELSLVRGLDYYTGPIFEYVVEKPKMGSIAGGGRYDNLIEIYTGKHTPSTGGSIGIERVIDAGLELGIFRLDRKTYTKVYVLSLKHDKETYLYSLAIANMLREKGIPTQVDVMRRSEQAQRRYALKKGINIVVYVGSKEVSERKVTIYDRTRNIRKVVALKDVVKAVKEISWKESIT